MKGAKSVNAMKRSRHRGFCQLLGAYHPSIWKFTEALKKEQSLNELKLGQFLAGQLPPAGKKKFKDCAERLKRVVAEYGKRPNMDYLRELLTTLSCKHRLIVTFYNDAIDV